MQNSQQDLAVVQRACEEIDELSANNSGIVNGIAKSMVDAFKCSALAKKVMDVLTPEVVAIMFNPLRNKEFGWREDRPGTYPIDVIRDVWVGALLKGALPTGDEVLIISGRAYYQKNFFRRKLATMPGLTGMVIMPGKVSTLPNGALVEMTITCFMNGKEVKISRTGSSAIPVRLQSGMGADAALGKAERKILCALFNQLTGSSFSEGEADETDFSSSPITVTQVQSQTPQDVNAGGYEARSEQPTQQPKPVQSKTDEVKSQVAAKRIRPAKEKEAEENMPWATDQESAVVEEPVRSAPAQQQNSATTKNNEIATKEKSEDEIVEDKIIVTGVKQPKPGSAYSEEFFTVVGENDQDRYYTSQQENAAKAKEIMVLYKTAKALIGKDGGSRNQEEFDQLLKDLKVDGGTARVEYLIGKQGKKMIVSISEIARNE